MSAVIYWFSRHSPLPAQRRALNELFPDSEIAQDENVFDDAKDIVSRFGSLNLSEVQVVIIAPLSLVARLLDYGVHPLWPEMEPVGKYYAMTHLDECVSAPRGRWFRFVRFRRLMRIEMKFEEINYADRSHSS